MKKSFTKNLKYILSFLLIILIITAIPFKAKAESEKKAIVLILDEISLDDLKDAKTPNIDSLLDQGALGFMNVRAKSSTKNKGSSYLSLGMGVRTLASTQGGLAFDSDSSYSLSNYNALDQQVDLVEIYNLYTNKSLTGEIANIAIEDIKRVAKDVTPNNQVGLLGKLARENNLKIAAIGNSDISGPNREFTMLAMDENGVIPYGHIGSDLLKNDYNSLAGIKMDSEKLMKEVDRVLPLSDILFLNFGDTVRVQRTDRLASDEIRVQQRHRTIEEADQILGQIMTKLDLEESFFLLLTPNPSKKMIQEGNFGLTPFMVSGPNISKGLLSSSTTNRKGLVTNFDFAPTLFDFFQVDSKSDLIGEPVQVIDDKNPIETLSRLNKDFLYIRKYRKVFHWGYIALILFLLLAYFLPIFTKYNLLEESFLKDLSATVLAIPIMMLTLPLIGYNYIVLDLIYVFLGSFLLAYLIGKFTKSHFKTSAILTLLTSILLLIDGIFIRELMIISPLGSDAIAGGRFYGIGNDYMGIILGSTLLGLFSIYDINSSSKTRMTVFTSLFLGIIIIALSPFIGANMGGTLSAISILLLALIIINDKKLSFKKLIVLGLTVLVIILGLAGLDASLNPNPTHAGKAILALLNGGYKKLFEIISIKLRQVFYNLFNANWNIVLFAQIILAILIYRLKKESLISLKSKHTNLFKGFTIILLGSLVIFMFNDTGTIAAAITLSYLFIPLGKLLRESL